MSEVSRLRWLCRRGMKELDVVMTAYLDSRYTKASEIEKSGFRTLLEMQDPELYALLLGRFNSPDQNIDSVVQSIRNLRNNHS